MQNFFLRFLEINTECQILFAKMIYSEIQLLLCTCIVNRRPEVLLPVQDSRYVCCPCISLQRTHFFTLLQFTAQFCFHLEEYYKTHNYFSPCVKSECIYTPLPLDITICKRHRHFSDIELFITKVQSLK